jgi:prepilin-type N-terminal cleavage/methylation domain-containing protein
MRRGERGVTLIELLVAMTLFSLLSAAVLYSLRTGIGSLDRARSRIQDSRRELGAQRAVELMIAGIVPLSAIFFDGSTGGAQPAPVPVPFFHGEPALLRFITTHSLQEGARGRRVIAELAVLPREERDGFRLVLQERPYVSPYQAGAFVMGFDRDPSTGFPFVRFRPFEPGTRLFVVADRLTSCRFEYLQWRLDRQDNWQPRWIEQQIWPKAIRIAMAPRQTLVSQVYVRQLP